MILLDSYHRLMEGGSDDIIAHLTNTTRKLIGYERIRGNNRFIFLDGPFFGVLVVEQPSVGLTIPYYYEMPAEVIRDPCDKDNVVQVCNTLIPWWGESSADWKRIHELRRRQ